VKLKSSVAKSQLLGQLSYRKKNWTKEFKMTSSLPRKKTLRIAKQIIFVKKCKMIWI